MSDATGAPEEWFCYMVRCGDGSLYVAIAKDVAERVKRHNWGVGPEFTARRRPVELVWSESCGDPDSARQREREIKGWSRSKKLALTRSVAQGKRSPASHTKTAGLP